MFGIDRNAARYTFTAILVVATMYLVFLVRQTLFIFILALLFAYLLSPLVNLIDRFLPTTRSRRWALVLAYLIFIGIAVFVGIQIGSRVVDQAQKLTRDLPPKVITWVKTPGSSETLNEVKEKLMEQVETSLGAWSTNILSALPQAGIKFLNAASNLIFLVIIPILSFFFLKDGSTIREHMLDMVDPGPRRALLDDVLADTHLLLAHYMRAQALMSLSALTCYAIFFAIVGVPYGVLLAVIASLLEIVPMIGPLTASILIVLISLVAGSHVLAVLIFLVAYRLAADYVLSPHLMGHGVQLHPLLVLFGVFAGAEVAGVAGTLLSVPVLAMVRIVYLRIRKARLTPRVTPRKNPGPTVAI
ncbi:MAG TPA: AI-2E family transporter [Bryobacteraceae bacterium]|nr:AI-2E family transporter [Bryobacteraceae bacterium]